MKKPLKITLISIGSLLAVLVVAILIAVWFVFTPERLTPIVRNALQKNIKCQSDLREVELTFFSTFPNFGVKLSDVVLINPIKGSASDTLLRVNNLVGKVNLTKFLFDKELIINEIILQNGFVNIYTDSTGTSNYDVFPSDTTKKDTTKFKMPFDFIDIKRIEIERLSVLYTDKQSGIDSKIKNLNLSLAATLNQENGNADFGLAADDVWFYMADTASLDVSMKKLSLDIDGSKNKDKIEGTMKSGITALNVTKGTDKLIVNRDLQIELPLAVDIKKLFVDIKNGGFIDISDNKITIEGWIHKLEKLIDMDIKFDTDWLNIGKIISLLPDNLKKTISDMTIEGDINVSGEVQGKLQGDTIPSIMANIDIKHTKYSQKGLPMTLRDINGQIQFNMNSKTSDIQLNKLRVKTGKSAVVLDGNIADLSDRQRCDLQINGNIDFEDIKAFVPDSMQLRGTAKTNLKGNFTVKDITAANLKRIKLKGKLDTRNLSFVYKDTTKLTMPTGVITVAIPSAKSNPKFKELVGVTVSDAPTADFEQVGTMRASLQNSAFDIGISDVMDKKTPLAVKCSYNIDRLGLTMDTITAQIAKPKGDFYMLPSKKNKNLNTFMVKLLSSSFDANYGKNVSVSTADVAVNGDITYDATQQNAFLQFLPHFDVKVDRMDVKTKELADGIKAPRIDFQLTPDKLNINKGRFVVKQSDFNLSGTITNIADYMKNTGMLKANLDFTSDMVNVSELMEMVSSFGAKDSVQKAAVAEKPQNGDKEPFMVPWNVDVMLNTKVSHGKVAETDIYNLGGKLIIKDGVLVLEQMGFTCEAAKMQLTAMYRSERKNHLFTGIDFHLLDIEIDKLIKMIPQIDTIVPMLRYFAGKGEFHLAAETYLNSNYDIKYSTLRGASAIEGKNLVLIDNETFEKMAKMLLFKKKTKNVVDSLAVELTVFRDEVELFPFLFSMDNYQVVLQGKYNLSQSYKIKAETISPVRIGVDLLYSQAKGLKLTKLKLLNLQYSNLFKPEKQNATQKQVMELKKMISDALKANVKPQNNP